jgi:hypothetical protein
MILLKNIRLIIVFVYSSICVGQVNISGSVSDSLNPISSATVILKDSLSKSIIAYTYTDDEGIYQLKTNKTGRFNLVVSSLGYEAKTVPLVLNSKQKNLKIDVVLKEKPMDLDEVIIQAESPISISNDTINFKTKYFTDSTEQTVEDLLRRIPGLQIDSEGTIKVGNQEIEKLMVDGVSYRQGKVESTSFF